MKKICFLFCTMAAGYGTSVEYKWERLVSVWMEGKTFVIEPPKNCVPSCMYFALQYGVSIQRV